MPWIIEMQMNERSVIADLVKRHAGVLGLSACILSSPYDVPTWMPQLLMDLSAHLNDPQPIEVTQHIWNMFDSFLVLLSFKKKEKKKSY